MLIILKVEEKMRFVPPETDVSPELVCKNAEKIKEQFPEQVPLLLITTITTTTTATTTTTSTTTNTNDNNENSNEEQFPEHTKAVEEQIEKEARLKSNKPQT